MEQSGAATVGNLDDRTVIDMAPKLWITLP